MIGDALELGAGDAIGAGVRAVSAGGDAPHARARIEGAARARRGVMWPCYARPRTPIYSRYFCQIGLRPGHGRSAARTDRGSPNALRMGWAGARPYWPSGDRCAPASSQRSAALRSDVGRALRAKSLVLGCDAHPPWGPMLARSTGMAPPGRPVLDRSVPRYVQTTWSFMGAAPFFIISRPRESSSTGMASCTRSPTLMTPCSISLKARSYVRRMAKLPMISRSRR